MFIVEMQVRWTSSFYKSLVFGADQAYVSQLRKGNTYNDLKEVLLIVCHWVNCINTVHTGTTITKLNIKPNLIKR
jgi:hypothetical protein